MVFNSAPQVDPAPSAAPIRQLPISYIRAFAYHPVAFPQPLAPITTYQVSRNPQSYGPSRNIPPAAAGLANALSQVIQQKFLQGPEGQQGYSLANPVISPPTQQMPPTNSQIDFGTPPPTTTTTSTTTPAPVTIPTSTQPPPSFSGSQPMPQVYSRFSDGYQRQLPIQQAYQSGNFGGFPPASYYNQPYQPSFNQFQYNEQVGQNQFSGRLFNPEPSYQQYSTDPLTYQFIPTSITPLQNQNNIKFVPCMCPVAVSIAPPLVEKRSEEIPILNPSAETDSLSQSVQSSSQDFDERK